MTSQILKFKKSTMEILKIPLIIFQKFGYWNSKISFPLPISWRRRKVINKFYKANRLLYASIFPPSKNPGSKIHNKEHPESPFYYNHHHTIKKKYCTYFFRPQRSLAFSEQKRRYKVKLSLTFTRIKCAGKCWKRKHSLYISFVFSSHRGLFLRRFIWLCR